MPARSRHPGPTRGPRRRFFEQLEDRRVMAVDLQLVNDTNPEFGDFGSVDWRDRAQAVEMNSSIYFAGHSRATGMELWRSDGSRPSSRQIADLTPGKMDSQCNGLVNHNGRLLFAANGDLWKSDGTPAGTQCLECSAVECSL